MLGAVVLIAGGVLSQHTPSLDLYYRNSSDCHDAVVSSINITFVS